MLLVLPASSLANACGSPAECAATVGEVTRWYGRSFPYRPSKLKACTGDVRAARALPSAGAKAAAFYEACTQGKSSWVNWDADAYFNSTWQPGAAHGGADCPRMTRFGPAWRPCPERAVSVHASPFPPRTQCVPRVARLAGRRLYEGEERFAALGDGGKTVCDAEALLRGPGCVVVSVGINANTEFEEALHRAHPQCEVVGYDGTLNAAKRARAAQRAPFLRVHERNFGGSLAANYTGTSVRLLKIDCDGCEFSALPAWAEAVCTEQIVVEVHRTLRHRPHVRVGKIHEMMMRLSALYKVFYLEPNAQYPWLATEFSLVRNEPCPREGKRGGP